MINLLGSNRHANNIIGIANGKTIIGAHSHSISYSISSTILHFLQSLGEGAIFCNLCTPGGPQYEELQNVTVSRHRRTRRKNDNL